MRQAGHTPLIVLDHDLVWDDRVGRSQVASINRPIVPLSDAQLFREAGRITNDDDPLPPYLKLFDLTGKLVGGL